MRVASTQYHTTMNTALQQASVRVENIMQKMAKGTALLVPSDDPITHVRLARLSREEAALAQYRDNIGALDARLRQNETLLDSMSSDMVDARDLLLWAANGANPGDDLVAMAGSLRTLAEGLFHTANSRDQEGRYLFSGTLSSTATLAYDGTAAPGSRYTLQGNNGEQKVVVGNGITQTANVTLDSMHDLLNRLDEAIVELESGAGANDPAVRAAVTAAMNQLDDTFDAVGTKIAGIGGARNIIATLDANHANVSLSNQQAAIDIGQLDYGDAAVKLNGYTSALQATQKAYAQVSKLSLFDVI